MIIMIILVTALLILGPLTYIMVAPADLKPETSEEVRIAKASLL
jgi:hypothetical protein